MRVCQECGEDWPAALYHEGALCRDHAVQAGISKEPYCEIIPHCLCDRINVPAQWHHLATERQQARYTALKPLGVLVCLNCHGILTERQCNTWEQSWKKDEHPVRCTIQGTADLLWLWWERSGRLVWEQQCAELVHVVWTVFLGLLQFWGLRGWGVVL
jgi:hypothetical protein